MSNRFSYEVYVPSSDEYVRFYELTNHMYLNILKFIRNSDDTGLVDLLENLMRDLCVTPGQMNTCDRLDKYCILLTMIMMCVGNEPTFTVTCRETQKEYTTDLKLSTIISKINELKVSNVTVDINSNNRVTLNIPTDLHGQVSSMISKITLNNKEFDVTQAPPDVLDRLIGSLPCTTMHSVHQAYKQLHSNCNDIVYFEHRSPYAPSQELTQYKFNLYDNSFFEFIKALLREDLLGYYKMYYSLTTKFNFDMTYIQAITPTETKMYISMIREDMKKQQDTKSPNNQYNPDMSPEADPGQT